MILVILPLILCDSSNVAIKSVVVVIHILVNMKAFLLYQQIFLR